VFDVDCKTPLTALFAAGEDTGGVHGANRLGGNGVANSTVFGGIAGDSMARWIAREGVMREADEAAIAASIAAHDAPFGKPAGDINAVREALYDLMWDDVGISRNADSLRRGLTRLAELRTQLDAIGVADGDRAYNLTWHDWLNLSNLIRVSQVITTAALAREDSRGAHFRADFPAIGDLPSSAYTVVRMQGDDIALTREPVHFTRVRPGESLLKAAA